MYAANRRLRTSEENFAIVISWESNLALADFAQIFKDLDNIFRVATREVTPRLKGTNSKRGEAALTVSDVRAGSLEILLNPYFSGVVSSLAAAAIIAVFTYTLRRTNGKRGPNDSSPLDMVSNETISEQKLREAANATVGGTANYRKSLRQTSVTFGLNISIKIKGKTIYLNDE